MPCTKKYYSQVGILLIIVITVLTYSNTFNATWHFDDYPNIIDNPGIHLVELNFQSIIQSLHASVNGGLYKGDSVYRPVAMFTFALNWYAGADRIFGYHVVNILIHVISVIFLFLTLRLILAIPRAGIKNLSIQYQAALLATVIWAIHPINTSAVTYIVQRMASLAGLFYIAGLYFYIKFRQTESACNRVMFFCAFVTAGVLAFFSKENSILILPSALLLEGIFFQDITIKNFFKPKIILIILALILLLFIVAAIWTGNDILRLVNAYDNRPFTPLQRLMTQSRVVCLYLCQLFYPLSSQFSMAHDIAISKTLFLPWTTLPAIFFMVSLLISGLVLQKKYPLIGFAILFFFINHGIESTLLNLELVFEHRNYVPSMFLFVPLTVWVTTYLIDYQKRKDKKNIFLIGSFFITVIIIAIGMGTYTRNFDWKTEKTLWEDALNKAPGRGRPYQILARRYYEKIGDWQTAAALYEKALPLSHYRAAYATALTYDRLHFVYLQMGHVEKALEYGKKSIETKVAAKMVQPFAIHYIKTLLTQNRLIEAEPVFRKLFAQGKTTEEGLNLLTRMYLQGRRPVEALKPAIAAFKTAPFDSETITYLGYANMVNNHYDRADRYFKKALQGKTQDDFFVRLCLIQNSINQGGREKTEFYIHHLLNIYPVQQIFDGLKESQTRRDLPVLLSYSKIKKLTADQIDKYGSNGAVVKKNE